MNNSPKDYLTDRIEALRELLEKQGIDMQTEDGYQVFCEQRTFLTDTIQQSMEVGREEGKQMAYLEMLGSETPLDYTGKARNAKELNENMIEFTKSLIKQHENAIKKLKSLSPKL